MKRDDEMLWKRNRIRYALFILGAVALLFRIFIGNRLGVWYSFVEIADDRLMIDYADLASHFTQPNSYSLVKTIAYPLFLNFVYYSGITYTLALSLLWFISAVLMIRTLALLWTNRWFLFGAYLFVLFTPCAMDFWCGTRLYRNAIIAPFVWICFSLSLHMLFMAMDVKTYSSGKYAADSLALGIFFSFTYYIKEDGIWLLACMSVLALITAVVLCFFQWQKGKIKENVKRTGPGVVLLCVPFMIFIFVSLGYRQLNQHYFGVSEINTRTDGELGKFVENVYDIDSEERDLIIWTPDDAIEQAFSASETLSQYPELEASLIGEDFDAQVRINEIPGDHLTWNLRNQLDRLGLWGTESEMQDQFRKVNNELAEAFESGKLKRTAGISISSMAPSRTWKEVLNLREPIKALLNTVVRLHSYQPGGEIRAVEVNESTELASILTHQNFLSVAATDLLEEAADESNVLVEKIFAVYKVVNPVLFVVAGMVFLLEILWILLSVKKRRYTLEERKNCILLLVMLIMSGFVFCYAMAIAWFSQFIWLMSDKDSLVLKFYGVGAVPMVAIFDLLGIAVLGRRVEILSRWQSKNGEVNG